MFITFIKVGVPLNIFVDRVETKAADAAVKGLNHNFTRFRHIDSGSMQISLSLFKRQLSLSFPRSHVLINATKQETETRSTYLSAYLQQNILC